MLKHTEPVEVIEVQPDFDLVPHLANSPNPVLEDEPARKILKALQVSRHPIVIRGIDIGNCSRNWTNDYLKRVAGEKKVKIHRSPTHQLDFRSKNFVYDTISFADLIEHCTSTSENPVQEYLYLRSLGLDPR